MFNNKEVFIKEYKSRIEGTYGISVRKTSPFQQYSTLATMVREVSIFKNKEMNKIVEADNKKKLYYFSLEFLMGRMLTNNLMNLGIYDVCKEGLQEFGIDINALEDAESDMGLGNGGLGRLAACFIDSIASLGYKGDGMTIRYQYGFFKQLIEDGYQVEQADPWLFDGNAWEIRNTIDTVEVEFYGHVVSYEDEGRTKFKQADTQTVRAVPYDNPIIGHDNEIVNVLRTWKAEVGSVIPKGKDVRLYESEVRAICESLYPDDSTREGRILRLKQQYFLVSAGLKSIIKKHLVSNENLDNFHEKNVLQINDTHPSLLVAELMRVLMDEYNYTWDVAWNITSQCLAYTNHTILSEALEKWPVDIMRELLPRVFMIVEEINRRFCDKLWNAYQDLEKVYRMAIISDHQVHMAHLAIVGSFSVNGVAALHTTILKEQEMREWHEHFPHKFNNKTNGITHRRWFAYCNRELSELVTEKIGDGWLHNPEQEFRKLHNFKDDEEFQQRFLEIKHSKKEALAAYMLEHSGVVLNPNSIFDVQIKRLHAYKRQLLNAMHIMYLYNRLKNDIEFRDNFEPHTFIFGAKAAPSYHFAKKVIKLINEIDKKISADSEICELLQVVFVENYRVTYAEGIIPAADVSEQISTASKEASGTGNMKFMMNGAVTLGTMDGANVEIHDLVGTDNITIFGMNKDEVIGTYLAGDYNPRVYYHANKNLRKVVDQLVNGFFTDVADDEFKAIHDELMGHDSYFVMKDFDSYVKAHERINELYKDKRQWAKMCIVNMAESGFFSTDRTIQNYIDDIWHLEKI